MTVEASAKRELAITGTTCASCVRSVESALAGVAGVESAEVNLAKDPVGRAELVRHTGMMSFPQVLVNGELLGGFAELHEAAESGRLDDLLAA